LYSFTAVQRTLFDSAKRLLAVVRAQEQVENVDGGVSAESAASLLKLKEEEKTLLTLLNSGVNLVCDHVQNPKHLSTLVSSKTLHPIHAAVLRIADHAFQAMVTQEKVRLPVYVNVFVLVRTLLHCYEHTNHHPGI
jgi:hypothetical protein